MFLPAATYRVQLNSSYTLQQLTGIVDYLHKLGISTIYAAPVTTSMKGSTHGYDVCNPDVLDEEIGTLPQLEALSAKLSEKGMSWLQDIVPNHMAFLCNNDRLFDVMERGSQSPYYSYFDINWNHFDPVYKGKLMVPFIGKDLNEAIDSNEIVIQFDDNGVHLAYYDEQYPVAAGSLPLVADATQNDELKSATQALLNATQSSKEEWKDAKKKWQAQAMAHKAAIGQALDNINANKALLRRFLHEQHYILTWYKVTDEKINFRRFFTVNQLICLRMEDEFVFNDYHRFAFDLYQKGLIQGLRIDHIDGLYNPQQYIERLRQLFGDDCYIIAEKILEYNEDVARDWKLQGTSGYEFLSYTNQLLTSKDGSEKILAFYRELVPQTPPYFDMVFDKKHSFLLTQMGGELENLMHYAEELNVFGNESYDRNKLKTALGIFMASFPVYRIYPDQYPLHEESLPIVKEAFEKAGEKGSEVAAELNLLQSVFYASGTEPGDENKLLFLMRLMQFTGPLAAKGVEDTTFYVYNPLISHNEVGDSPSQLGIRVKDFHDKMLSRQQKNPYSLNGTSTHDTKRGEDGRMRINALAAMPDEWIQMVNGWRQMNTPFVKTLNNKPAPTTNDEYFIYQSLIGAFPEDAKVTDSFRERTQAFLQKALREAKAETTYAEPNEAYEEACQSFVASLLDEKNPFLENFIPFLQKVIQVATLYSLAQTVIKITAPGIPDIYQGCELWDISYVDPDNRRPVDYECRKQTLDEIAELEKDGAAAVLPYLKSHKKEGREKLYVTYKTLNLRTANNDLFLHGEYLPLRSDDEKVVAYARKQGDRWVVVVIPFEENEDARQGVVVSLPEGAPEQWTNLFTGEKVETAQGLSVEAALANFPIAVLTAGL